MIIGLAGRSCSGKNVVSSMLKKKGFETVDMDLMVHELLDDMSGRISKEFGMSLLGGDGKINRKELGRIVFPDPVRLKKLEDIIYPELHNRVKQFTADRNSGIPVVLNAAALQKDDFWSYCDKILWVQSPLVLRVFRGWRRDRRSLADILKRFRAQKELKSQYFSSRVDTYIIRNGLFRSSLQSRVDQWVKYLLPER